MVGPVAAETVAAAPAPDPAADLRGSLKRRWRPLPATAEKARDLAFYFGDTHDNEPATLLLAKEATEARIHREISGKRYVHLATHGYFAEEHMASAADAAREAANGWSGLSIHDQRTELAGWMPGLLAGIVLAGANASGAAGAADGILTASEVIWLDLRSCELVTLSACETGLGAERDGEHLLGLRRALQIAGARATITSLWKVGDEATQELMQGFYERLWFDGESKSDALRNAQLEMLNENRRKHGEGLPKSWGAFVLEGDWR